jgi:hypothetical protein
VGLHCNCGSGVVWGVVGKKILETDNICGNEFLELNRRSRSELAIYVYLCLHVKIRGHSL